MTWRVKSHERLTDALDGKQSWDFNDALDIKITFSMTKNSGEQ